MEGVFTIEQMRPMRDGMTISRDAHLGTKTGVTFFSLGSGTSISQESYDIAVAYIGAAGTTTLRIGSDATSKPLSKGDFLLVAGGTLCGMETADGSVYTEIRLEKENLMNDLVKAGEVMKLKDIISYEEGSIANVDVVSNDTMKFVLMAFDEGTGLSPHRAPGNAIIFALEGNGVIGYEGKDYPISAGENFRFEKNGLHSVTANGKFKMALLLVLE